MSTLKIVLQNLLLHTTYKCSNDKYCVHDSDIAIHKGNIIIIYMLNMIHI